MFFTKTHGLLCGLVALPMMAAPAVAQNKTGAQGGKNAWTGEGTVSGAYTSGNTQTTEVGIAVKAAKQFGKWDIKGNLEADYGENNDVESRNRWALAGQLNRKLTERWLTYGRGTYEEDKFSGFDSRLFFGAGVGYKVLTGGAASWTLEAGPGYRRDVI